MGVVYKAEDLRLERFVALKFLSSQLESGDDRLRFSKEARAASSLDHPNICTVYEIDETADGQMFIAMALCEGETLKAKIRRAPLRIEEAVDYTTQIAAGLARAHSRGLVHRDIKPSNLIVTPEGQVKIVDFGLVQLAGETRLTRTGIALGTTAYMSPEQIRGGPVDHRTDIWSLGAVLYEMLTGQTPFQGENDSVTAYAIQFMEPEPVSGRRSGVPLRLDHLVAKALSKDPGDRYQHADEIPVDLRSLQRNSGSSPSVTGTTVVSRLPLPWPSRPLPLPAPRKRSWRKIALAGLGGLAAAGGLLLAGWLLPHRQASPVNTTPSFKLLTFRRGTIRVARFTPDGQTIVYGAAWDGEPTRLYMARTEGPLSTSIDLPPADLLSISPHGEMAISLDEHLEAPLLAAGTLARAPLLGGGAVREVLNDIREADWAPEGSGFALVRRSLAGERLEFPGDHVLVQTSGFISHARFSPDGSRIAFLDHPVIGDDRGAVAVVDRAGHKTTLSTDWSTVRGLAWSPDGKEVWFTGVRSGEGIALYSVDLKGNERTLLTAPGSLILLDVARDGTVLLEREDQLRQVHLRTPDAPQERDISWLDLSAARGVSDDGKNVLLTHFGEGSGANYSVYLRGSDGSPGVPLGEGEAMGLSPDGTWAAALIHGPPARILLLPTGAGESRSIQVDLSVNAVRWFPDGQRLLVVGREEGHGARCFLQELAGGKPRPVTPEGARSESWSPVSPDGRWIITTGPDGRSALYPVAGGAPRPIPGLEPGEIPIRFEAGGKALFVERHFQVPLRVYRIDLASGQRTLWQEIRPADLAGIIPIQGVLLSLDGRSYVYNSQRLLTQLYLVRGLR
jgi:hypothetical protein